MIEPVLHGVLLKAPLIVLCFLFSTSGFADMRINKAIVQFYADDLPRQDVEVSNVSDQDLYLQVEVHEVLNPGTASQQLVQSKNVDDVKFLASPNKAIIAPGGKRKVRLVNLLEPVDEERIYRVTFKPIPVQQDPNQTMVTVLVAYQTLVIIRPREISQELSAERADDRLLLRNSGNSNVLLQNGRLCEGDSHCKELPVKRLYPGNELEVALNGNGADVSYVLNYGRSGQETRHF